MKEWAKEFYRSKAWRKTREYIFSRDNGLCVRCSSIGEIVHHKTYLTPDNISDPDISLSEDNLELVCRNCHAVEHEGELSCDRNLMFDSDGNLIQRSDIHDRQAIDL